MNQTANPTDSAVREVARNLFERHYGARLMALVLTGSMARGEATAVEANGRQKILGDAEFLLIFHEDSNPLPTPIELLQVCGEIESELSAYGVTCAIGANRAYPEYLVRMQPHIFGYELRECGQVLSGDTGILSLIPPFRPDEIPHDEAWQLLMNRLIELLQRVLEMPPAAHSLDSAIYYRTAKLYLDMASSLLLFQRNFEAGYGARREKLLAIARSETPTSGGSPFPLEPFADRVAEATAYKLTGVANPGMRTLDYLREALAYAHDLWRWELLWMTSANPNTARQRLAPLGSDGALFDRWARSQPLFGAARGWLSGVRRRSFTPGELLRSFRISRGWQRSPRYCIYKVASMLVFRLPGLLAGDSAIQDHWQPPGRLLPLRSVHPQPEPAWKLLGREIVRNYEELLVGTRS